MTDYPTAPSSSPRPSRQPSYLLVSLLPFALMLAASSIFWCSLPMRKRQKKVQEFQAALKVGDRVITTGGIYGAGHQGRRTAPCSSRLPTRSASRSPGRRSAAIRDRSPSSSRTAAARYKLMYKNLRWKFLAIVGRHGARGLGVHAAERRRSSSAWTSRAACTSSSRSRRTTRSGSRRRRPPSSSAKRSRRRTSPSRHGPITLTSSSSSRAIPPANDPQFRTLSDEQVGRPSTAPVGAGGIYAFTMKPNIAVQPPRAEAVTQAIQTIERRVNELGVSEPVVARYGSAGDQIIVQLPGVTDVDRAKKIIQNTALLEMQARRGRAGARSRRRCCSRPRRAGAAGTWKSCRASAAIAATRSPSGLPRARGAGGHRPRSAERAVDGRRVQHAGRQVHAEQRGRRSKFGERDRRQRRPAARDRARRPGAVGAAHRERDHRRPKRGSRARFTQEEVADLSLILRSGALPASLTYLEEREVGPTLGDRLDPAGVMASLVGLALVTLFMLVLLQARRHQRARLGRAEPRHPAGVHGLPRRGR